MKLIPLPAFQDASLWVSHERSRALVGGPGDAHPVLACLQRDRLQVEAILVMHHRPDHGRRPLARHARDAVCRRRPPGAPCQVAGLRGATRVCRTHESALSALKFARAAEPDDARLINCLQRCGELRARDLPTWPATIGGQRQITPFLRTRLPAVTQVAGAHDAATPPEPVSGFATLRQWKNEFK
jgi:hypothetical protein